MPQFAGGGCQGVDIVLLRRGSGSPQREPGERANLGQNEDETGQDIGAKAGVGAVALPVVAGGNFADLLV